MNKISTLRTPTSSPTGLRRRFGEERQRVDLPAVGGGQTRLRFERFAALAGESMSLARLVEADADARAIVAELRTSLVDPAVPYGVWASTGARSITVREIGGCAVELYGDQPWCGGATLVQRALLVVDRGNICELIDVTVDPDNIDTSGWSTPTFSELGTATMHFDGTAAVKLHSETGDYARRPGFWHGAVGVAACWVGATQALLSLHAAAWSRQDSHSLAQLGAAFSEVEQSTATIRAAADEIDRDPQNLPAASQRAAWVRYCVDRSCTRALDHLAVGSGPGPFAHNASVTARTDELRMALRQSHGLRDVEDLGRDYRSSTMPR